MHISVSIKGVMATQTRFADCRHSEDISMSFQVRVFERDYYSKWHVAITSQTRVGRERLLANQHNQWRSQRPSVSACRWRPSVASSRARARHDASRPLARPRARAKPRWPPSRCVPARRHNPGRPSRVDDADRTTTTPTEPRSRSRADPQNSRDTSRRLLPRLCSRSSPPPRSPTRRARRWRRRPTW